MNITNENKTVTSSTHASYFENAMIELEEIIEDVYN